MKSSAVTAIATTHTFIQQKFSAQRDTPKTKIRLLTLYGIAKITIR